VDHKTNKTKLSLKCLSSPSGELGIHSLGKVSSLGTMIPIVQQLKLHPGEHLWYVPQGGPLKFVCLTNIKKLPNFLCQRKKCPTALQNNEGKLATQKIGSKLPLCTMKISLKMRKSNNAMVC
jgi:hypothetical protein